MKRILVKVMFDSPHAYRAQPTILPHKNHPVQNVHSAKVEKPRSNQRVLYKTIFVFLFIYSTNIY